MHGSPRSPFARRARIALLSAKVDFEWKAHPPEEIWPPCNELLAINPLGLVPALALPKDWGIAGITDSAEILTFIDDNLARIWPAEKTKKIAARRISKLAEGVMTYAVREFQDLRVTDPVHNTPEDNFETIRRTLAQIDLELSNSSIELNESSQHAWDCAVALQYLDFRHAARFDWRSLPIKNLEKIFSAANGTAIYLETAPR